MMKMTKIFKLIIIGLVRLYQNTISRFSMQRCRFYPSCSQNMINQINNKGLIRDIVSKFKKRVELRPDPSTVMDKEKAEKEIKKLIPKEAGIENIIFDEQRSRVIIEAEKPGLAIGKQGDILRDIRKKILWVPLVRRTPAIKSKIIEGVRSFPGD